MNDRMALVEHDTGVVHLECGLAWTTLCGETLGSDVVERDIYSLGEHHDANRCRECVLTAQQNAADRRGST